MSGLDDVPRTIREFRQQGWPIEVDGRGQCRLLPEEPGVPRGDGKRVGGRLRVQILERDGGRCQLCGIGAGEPDDDGTPARMQIDHIVPREHDGPTESANLRVLCSVCNRDKQAWTFAVNGATREAPP